MTVFAFAGEGGGVGQGGRGGPGGGLGRGAMRVFKLRNFDACALLDDDTRLSRFAHLLCIRLGERQP